MYLSSVHGELNSAERGIVWTIYYTWFFPRGDREEIAGGQKLHAPKRILLKIHKWKLKLMNQIYRTYLSQARLAREETGEQMSSQDTTPTENIWSFKFSQIPFWKYPLNNTPFKNIFANTLWTMGTNAPSSLSRGRICNTNPPTEKIWSFKFSQKGIAEDIAKSRCWI